MEVEIEAELVVVLGIVLLAICYGVGLYNSLVSVNRAASRALENMDVLLQQRHHELPKLVEVCKQYQQFDPGILQSVIRARSAVQVAGVSGDVDALGRAEGGLRVVVGRVFAVLEAYPDLKDNPGFSQLQNRINALDTGISERRVAYNDVANTNNVLLASFPDNLIARWLRFAKKPLLEFAAVDVSEEGGLAAARNPA